MITDEVNLTDYHFIRYGEGLQAVQINGFKVRKFPQRRNGTLYTGVKGIKIDFVPFLSNNIR